MSGTVQTRRRSTRLAPRARSAGKASAGPDLRDLPGPLLVALLGGNEAEVAGTLAEAERRGADLALVAREIVSPVLAEVGALWLRGEASVAEEHLATSLISRVLARMAARVPPPPAGAPRLLLACLAGEFHDLGLRIAAEVAREAGWEAECLGGNVPRGCLVGFVAQRAPTAVALSLTLPAHIPEAARAIEEIRAAAPGVKLLVGGGAFRAEPELARLTGADAFVPDSVALRDWLRCTEAKSRGGAGTADGAPCCGGLPASMPNALRRKLGKG